MKKCPVIINSLENNFIISKSQIVTKMIAKSFHEKSSAFLMYVLYINLLHIKIYRAILTRIVYNKKIVNFFKIKCIFLDIKVGATEIYFYIGRLLINFKVEKFLLNN